MSVQAPHSEIRTELVVSENNDKRHLSIKVGESISDALRSHDIKLSTPCGGIGACGLCRIRIKEGHQTPSAGEKRLLSEEEMEGGLRLACLARPSSPLWISVDPVVPFAPWQELEDDSPLTEPNNEGEPPGLADIPVNRRHGKVVAVDLGTTQIRMSIRDVRNPHRSGACIGLNPQFFAGADVLTRLSYAVASERNVRELAWLARGAIGEGLNFLLAADSTDRREVTGISIVGNTAMLSLLCEDGVERLLDPASWARPVPVVPSSTASWIASWQLKNADVEVVAPCAGFVGSDLLAAILTSRLLEAEAPALLIDFGTNSEIALWDGQSLLVTSTAGGPAFEGAGITCGMPAVPGAIYRAELSAPGSTPLSFRTLGNVFPRGICGSGLVDVIAILRKAGFINPTGRYTVPVSHDTFPLVEGHIGLTMKDIDMVQRAKAAIGAGTLTLLRESGLRAPDLRRICICGSFGRHLNAAHARSIGLLPDCPDATVDLIENAALSGCEMMACSRRSSETVALIRSLARAIDLSSHADFGSLFFDCLTLRPLPPDPWSKKP